VSLNMINMRKVAIIGLIPVCALLLSACNLYKTPGGGQTGGAGGAQQQNSGQSQQQQGEVAATVTFSDSGVSPATVTIKSGQAVKWVNSSSATIQVASDPHPTHTDNRELTNGQSTVALSPGASATVTLVKMGSWGYHNHLNPSVRGKVVVQ